MNISKFIINWTLNYSRRNDYIKMRTYFIEAFTNPINIDLFEIILNAVFGRKSEDEKTKLKYEKQGEKTN